MNKNKLIIRKEKIIEIVGTEYLRLASIVNDKFGIINAILERYELINYNLFMYQCLSANTKDLFGLSKEVSSGGLGVDDSKKGAMISCLAEAIERYCMSFVPKEEIQLATLKELDKSKTFKEFHIYSKEQYLQNKSFLNPKSDRIHWTKIYSAKNNKVWKYWPASLIYLPFEQSNPVAENTSTGMAAGFTIESCICSGLLELIERDALMINFLQRLNPPEIDINSITGNNKKLIDEIVKDYSIKIYKLYSDINVPIYLSLIWKKAKGKIHYGIGASANLDSDYAINKSLKECLFTYFYSKNIMDLKKDNPKEIKALYEHFLYYQEEKFYELLFKSNKENYIHEITSIDKVIEDLKKANIEVYYKELTTSDIKDTNIKVVKVIAPGLIDLNKSHILPRLGAKRFWDVPRKLGLKYSKTLSDKPHPFP